MNPLERLLKDKMEERGISGFDELASKVSEVNPGKEYAGEDVIAVVHGEESCGPCWMRDLCEVLELSNFEILRVVEALGSSEALEPGDELEAVLFRMAHERGIRPSWGALAEAMNRAAPDGPGYGAKALARVLSPHVPLPRRIFRDLQRALVLSPEEKEEFIVALVGY